MRSAPRLLTLGLAAVLTALFAAPARASGGEQHAAVSTAVRALPAAGWRGRPIRQAADDGAVVAQTVVAGQAPLRPGAGYRSPGGSPAVRQVQRLLRRIGYRPGPVDGKFGPLTRSSVQWFQIKHGLRATGGVGAAELALLRLRASGKSPARVRGVRVRTAAPPVVRGVSPEPFQARPRSGGLPTVAVLGMASAFALLAAGGWLLARRARASRFGVSSRRRRQALGVAGGSAVGYLRKGDDQEETRHAEAIQRACAERGWAVARIVREASVNGTDAHSRPGLAFAFDELARRPGSRLVACRLDDVGRTRRELATVLEWCSRSRVHLLALDVGLDTGTPAGSLAARCLVAVGNGGCSRRRRAQRDGAKVGA